MSAKKKEYIKKIEEQLEQWDARIDEFKERALGTQRCCAETMKTIKAQLDHVKKDAAKMKDASENTLGEFKVSLENARQELDGIIKSARSASQQSAEKIEKKISVWNSGLNELKEQARHTTAHVCDECKNIVSEVTESLANAVKQRTSFTGGNNYGCLFRVRNYSAKLGQKLRTICLKTRNFIAKLLRSDR